MKNWSDSIETDWMGGNRMDGEKLVTMEGDVLRAIFRSELRSGGCYGEGRDKEQAKAMADRIGKIFDVEELLHSLAEFLAQYEDFTIEKTRYALCISGKQENRRKKRQRTGGYFRLEYNGMENMVMVSLNSKEIFYCNFIDLVDNLTYRFGLQLALCIQEDEMLKQFYQDYLDWLRPYTEQLAVLRQEFLTALVGAIGRGVGNFPPQKVDWMPVEVNIPYITDQFQQILRQCHLPQLEMPQMRQEIGFQIQDQPYAFSFLVDCSTYNAVAVQYLDRQIDKNCYRRILTGPQTVALLKQLQAEGEKQENPFFRLMGKELELLLYRLLVLKQQANNTEGQR